MRQTFFKIINELGAGVFLRRQKKDTLTVLSLHRIADETDLFWEPIRPHLFEGLLQYITKYYTVTTFAELGQVKNGYPSKPLLVLSFDDGYYDFYENALPLLKKYGLPCNHNIVNDCVNNNEIIWTQRLNFLFNHCKKNGLELSFMTGEKSYTLMEHRNNYMQFYLSIYKFMLKLSNMERQKILEEKEKTFSVKAEVRMMNWNEIADCAANKVEIGSHTYSHDVLSTITDIDLLKKEVIDSVMEIRENINKKINVLALPNGEGNNAINSVAAEAGIEHILYVGEKINTLHKYSAPGIKDTYRINLVNEPYTEMVLRTELFHSNIKKYV